MIGTVAAKVSTNAHFMLAGVIRPAWVARVGQSLLGIGPIDEVKIIIGGNGADLNEDRPKHRCHRGAAR